MSDGSYFDGAPQQSDWGVNQEGSVFDDPMDALKKAYDQIVGIKQFAAFDKYRKETGPLLVELHDGEASFEEFFTIMDTSFDLAVNLIESVEAMMAVEGMMFENDPSGIIGTLISTVTSMGLTFFIEFLQPVQDLFGMLTGNPERIRTSREMWDYLARGYSEAGIQLVQHADRLEAAWSDDAADTARLRLREGNGILQLSAALSTGVAGSLEFCAATFDKVQNFLVNRAADIAGFMTELVIKALQGPVRWPEVVLDAVPIFLRITLELLQLGMYMARAFGALIGLMTGAAEAVASMDGYLGRMSATA